MVLTLATKGSSDLPLKQRDVRETPASTSSSSSSTSILAPVGSIMAWLKSFTNTPQALPDGWMEADGSAISDADSVYNGQNAPDLNGGEFIRGGATSGGTGGGTTGAGSAHTHVQDGSITAEDTHEHDFSDGHTHGLSAGYARFGWAGAEWTSEAKTSSSYTVDDVGPNASRSSGGGSSTAGIQLGGSTDSGTASGTTTNGDSHTHADTFSNANESSHTHTSAPKYYDVVWIFRYK